MTNASYVVASLSDPLSLGWNLLGTAELAWQPLLTAGLAPAQTLALAGGMIWSARVAQKTAADLKISPIPVMIFCAVMVFMMMWLLL